MSKNVTIIPAVEKQTSQKKNDRLIRTAAYCRVSTEQDQQQGSFENQIEYYTELISRTPEYVMAGIFTDAGISGTRASKRAGFQKLISFCEAGNVDLVITKSISRFARNTADCLYYARRLKEIGIPVIFEKEGINTMESTGELLFTILSSLAQEESRSISENVQWGIRSRFRQGIPRINTTRFLGYDKDENGTLVINETQAQIVRRIFRDYLEGWSTSEIARRLNESGTIGISGKCAWNGTTIFHILQNEKYAGDVLMQKTYTVDFLSHSRRQNDGEVEQYYVRNAHEAIIPREEWDAVQLEIARKDSFRKEHGTHDIGSAGGSPLFNKVLCACSKRHYNDSEQIKIETDESAEDHLPVCGGIYKRCVSNGRCRPFWRCRACGNRIEESVIRESLVGTWNKIVNERKQHFPLWKEVINSGDALERVRARQMILLTQQPPLVKEVAEHTRMVLKEVVIHDDSRCEIRFQIQ